MAIQRALLKEVLREPNTNVRWVNGSQNTAHVLAYQGLDKTRLCKVFRDASWSLVQDTNRMTRNPENTCATPIFFMCIGKKLIVVCGHVFEEFFDCCASAFVSIVFEGTTCWDRQIFEGLAPSHSTWRNISNHGEAVRADDIPLQETVTRRA